LARDQEHSVSRKGTAQSGDAANRKWPWWLAALEFRHRGAIVTNTQLARSMFGNDAFGESDPRNMPLHFFGYFGAGARAEKNLQGVKAPESRRFCESRII
jgi:hypothetical protein